MTAAQGHWCAVPTHPKSPILPTPPHDPLVESPTSKPFGHSAPQKTLVSAPGSLACINLKWTFSRVSETAWSGRVANQMYQFLFLCLRIFCYKTVLFSVETLERNSLTWFSVGARYAETWDYHVRESSLIQFDISMACGGQYATPYDVGVDYSTDLGRNWRPLVEECLPPRTNCKDYKAGSFLKAQDHRNWTRVTLVMPRDAM
jgi:hypothetical protein